MRMTDFVLDKKNAYLHGWIIRNPKMFNLSYCYLLQRYYFFFVGVLFTTLLFFRPYGQIDLFKQSLHLGFTGEQIV